MRSTARTQTATERSARTSSWLQVGSGAAVAAVEAASAELTPAARRPTRSPAKLAARDDTQELAKQAQNPIANLISVP